MIDTIKIIIPYNKRPKWLEKARFQHSFDVSTGYFKAIANPTTDYKRQHIYQPRLTYSERPRGHTKSYELAIELSLPKLMFGNNFNELAGTDLELVSNKLSATLKNTYGIWIFPHQIEEARVSKIDYSKNIIFTDYTPVSTIVSSMRMVDISKVYDIQNTNFRNGGHIFHIHTNSLDVTMYDKIADLNKSKVSEKRCYEKDNYTQISILDQLIKHRSITVARFEVRFNGMKKIRDEMKAIGIESDIRFKDLYSVDISRKVLLRHWKKIFDRIPKALLDTDTPEQILLNITKTNPNIKAREALAMMGLKLLSNAIDARYMRNLIEGLFSKSQYRRLFSKKREQPNMTQLKTLMQVTRALTAMTPVSIDAYIQ